MAGDYTLTVTGGSLLQNNVLGLEQGPPGETGPYQFRLSDLAAATALTPGTPVSGSLDPANETDLYRFTAAAGDRFYFDLTARTAPGHSAWRLFDPYGNQLFNKPFNDPTSSDVDALTLAQPGDYTLLVEGAIADTVAGTYTFNVQPAPIRTPRRPPLTLGDWSAARSPRPASRTSIRSRCRHAAALLRFAHQQRHPQLDPDRPGRDGGQTAARSAATASASSAQPPAPGTTR